MSYIHSITERNVALALDEMISALTLHQASEDTAQQGSRNSTTNPMKNKESRRIARLQFPLFSSERMAKRRERRGDDLNFQEMNNAKTLAKHARDPARLSHGENLAKHLTARRTQEAQETSTLRSKGPIPFAAFFTLTGVVSIAPPGGFA